MASGLFDHLKKKAEIKRERVYSRVVLVGLNWESLELFNFFSQRFGTDQVAIIDQKEWNEDHFFYPGPCVDRGEFSEQLLQRFVPGIVIRRGEESLFYKDQKFRSFRGRAMPHRLREGETHFKLFPNFFDPKAFLDGNISEKVTRAREAFSSIEVKKIALIQPSDLAEPAHFNLTLANHRNLQCEYLFFGRSPREFLHLVKDRGPLSEEFVQFSAQFEKKYSLVAIFDFDSEVIDSGHTRLIPQSQTHDDGHFIVEVVASSVGGGQTVKVCCGMSSEEVGEEEVAKKLKLLKRTLRRLFPSFRKVRRVEKFYLLDYFPYCPIEMAEVAGPNNFAYFGWNAPLERELLQQYDMPIDTQEVFNNARSLLSIKQIQTKFDRFRYE